MKLVVGIGNPGKRYQGTRHNVGFDIMDLLARQAGASKAKRRFEAQVVEAVLGGDRVAVMQPQTYVNETGRAVRQASDWYRLSPEDLLVVCDDLNLSLGRLRLRPGGSSGGHRGLESVERSLGTQEFPRLRVGIGEPPRRDDGGEAVDYVLGRFTKQERAAIDAACQTAVDAIERWIRDGIEAAMNQFNRSDLDNNAKGGSDT